MALAQAISNTQATAARTMSSVEPASPTTRAFRSWRPQVAFSSWYDDFQMGKRRAFVARSVSSAEAREMSGRRRPIAIVKNGPFRLGTGHRAAVNIATFCSSGPVTFCNTPTIV